MKTAWEAGLLRSRLYELLSQAFLYPREDQLDTLRKAAIALAGDCAERGEEELERACRDLHQALVSTTQEYLLDEYLAVFGHGVSKDCPQYACEYNDSHIFLKSKTLSDLATFYKAFGVGLRPDLHDRLDHISVELEFMRLLVYKEVYGQLNGHGEDKIGLCRDAQRSFLAEHVIDWSKPFVHKLRMKVKKDSLFGKYATLLETHLAREFAMFDVKSTPFSMSITPQYPEEDLECETCPMAIGPG